MRSANTDHVIGWPDQVLLSSQPRNNFIPVITTGTAKSDLQRLLEGESRTKARETYNASSLLEERVPDSVGGRFLSRVFCVDWDRRSTKHYEGQRALFVSSVVCGDMYTTGDYCGADL